MFKVLGELINKKRNKENTKWAHENFKDLSDEIVKNYFKLDKNKYHIEIKWDKPREEYLGIKVFGNTECYVIKINFGIYVGKSVLYIDDFSRVTDEHGDERIGSCLLEGIADMAEWNHFKYICIHPVASDNIKDALSQSELEAWYRRHLENRKFELRFVSDMNECHFLE